MDNPTFSILLSDAHKAITERNLSASIRILEGILNVAPDWKLSEKVNEIKNTYERLLAFFSEGMLDTEREKQYLLFLQRTAEVYDALYHGYLLTQKEHHYAITAKTLQKMQLSGDLPTLLQSPSTTRTLFEAVYTSSPWTATTFSTLQSFMEQKATETQTLLLLSATMLGALTVFDVYKWELLLAFCHHAQSTVRARALVGAVLVSIKHHERLALYPEKEERLRQFAATPSTKKQVQQLQLQLFVSLDTEAIQQRMEKEILPAIMETSKEISKRTQQKGENFFDSLSSLTQNPEWEQKGLLSKATDSIKKLYEWQQQGADVYLSSFAVLKGSIPFFQIAANWFLPFTLEHPDWDNATRQSSFSQQLERTSLLCNSDKYSFIYLFRSFPEAQRKIAEQQLSTAFAEKMEQQTKAEEAHFNDALRVYIQDLYRFFKLFSMTEGKAISPFQQNLLFMDYAPLVGALLEKDTLLEIADLLFKQKNYFLASSLFQKASLFDPDNAAVATEMFQKMGFCFQSLSMYEEAIAAYEKALLFSQTSTWTIKQLIRCHQQKGSLSEAQQYAQQVLEKTPEDKDFLLLIAQSYIQERAYEQARNYLLKLVYLENHAGEAVRALAWCYLWLGDTSAAAEQYEKILPQENASDYMNAGHCAWLRGKNAHSISLYRQYLRLTQQPFAADNFFAEDQELLLQRGITELQQKIMLDAINA